MKAVKGGKDAKSNTPRGENHLHRSVEKEGSKQPPHEGDDVNYSESLLQLIHPYRQPSEDKENLHYLLGLGVIAWNMTAMKGLAPQAFATMKEETKQEFSADKKSFLIIEKMLAKLQKNYAPIEMLVRDFTIEEIEDKLQVKLSMLSFDEFLKEVTPGLEEFTAEEDDSLIDSLEDAEEGDINRNGISVQPKQPLLDWLNKQSPAYPVALPPDGTTYLIDEMDSAEEIHKWLEKNYDLIFTRELDSWHSDPSNWPPRRNYKMFNEWFSVSVNTMIYDIGSLPLEKG